MQFSYLSTLLNSDTHHGIWVEIIHPGLQIKQNYQVQKIHGVPVSKALGLGLFALVFILILSVLYIDNIWTVAVVCMVAGAVAQSIGAYIYKTYNFVRNWIIS